MARFIQIKKPPPEKHHYINVAHVIKIIHMSTGRIKLFLTDGNTIEFEGNINDVLRQAVG